MGIYRKIDKTVKMHINRIKVYIPHLTVSGPINAILASFDVLVSHLGKPKLNIETTQAK